MAFNKQRDLIIALLTTALILVAGTATTNVDCKGKAFHCVNSTHFKICVDFGGVSKTVDDFLILCPPSTACTDSNYYECEYQIPTTSAPLARQSDVTNELFKKTVTSPWELHDVITLFPINNNEKSVEWLENSTIASPEIVSKAAGTETVDIANYKVVNEVLNEVTTESEYIIHKTTVSDLRESENNTSKSTDSILNNYFNLLTLTDETNNLSDHKISANISSLAITEQNYSTTDSKISIDVFDTMTISSKPEEDADFQSTNLNHPVITDSLNKNNLLAAETTENYLGTKSEVLIDQYKHFITTPPDAENVSTTISFPLKTDDLRLNIGEEATENYAVTENDTSISILEQVETTPKIIEGSDDFATTILSTPMKSDDLGLKSSLTTKITEKSGIVNETLITNNKVNTHFTTTLLVPMTENLLNTPNIEINLTVTSDSYSTSTEQYSTVSDMNSPKEITTTSNDMYTNASVTGTGSENETMITNNKLSPHLTTTKLSAPMITEDLLNTSNIEIYLTVTSDFYSTSTEQYSTVSDENSPIKTATTTNDMYINATVTGIGTENETSITNNEVNPHLTTTKLSAPMITEDLLNTSNIEIYLTVTPDSYSTSTEQYSTVSDKNPPIETATTTNDMYTNATVTGTGTENETAITNNEVSSHFSTTTLSDPITESLINTQNIGIHFTVTSYSNSAGTEQYSTVRDNNSPTETAASTNQIYTNAVTKTSHSRLDNNSLNGNDMNINRIDEISPSSSIQMEFFPKTTVNIVLRDTLQVFSINEENNLSSLVGSVDSLNAENIVTSSDITKFTTVTDLDETNTQTNVLYTNAPIANENIILNTYGTSTTKLDVTVNESSLIREHIANSSTDINLTTKSDSSEANVRNNTPQRDKNSPTLTTKTVSDNYTIVTNKNFKEDEFSMHENGSSTLPLSDFPCTVGYDEELLSTTAINIVLNNTPDKILTKEQSDISIQKTESQAISDIINNELLESTTIQPTSAIDLTSNSILYDVIFSTPSVNGIKFHKNVTKKISNNTKEEFLRHENGTYENIIDEITSPLPQIADIKSTANTENIAVSFIGSLNSTVEELSMKGKSDLSPPITTGSPSVTEISESYVDNTKQHMDETKVNLPILSTIDETIQNNPTTQNIVTGILDGTNDEHGSTQNFEIKQREKITNVDSVSTPSVFLHFSKHNDNLTEPFNNRFKEKDNDSNITYGSSHPLNLSNSTSKSNNTYAAEHNTEHTINLTTTSETQATVTLNDSVKNFSTLEPIFNFPVENESTVSNVYDYIITTHSYIRNGTGVRSHSTEGDILKTTMLNKNPSMNSIGTDLNPSALINDRYNSVTGDIYSSTSAKNTVIENYSYKNNLPDYVIESSTSTSSVIDSFDVNTVVSTLVKDINSTSFAEANTSVIFNKSQDVKNDKTSINVNIIDELPMSIESFLTEPSLKVVYLVNNSTDKDLNNIKPTLETNSNPIQLLSKAPIKNTFTSTKKTTPHKSATNMLKKSTAELNETYLPSNNTSMGIEYKYTTRENGVTLTNVAKDNLQIFVTNEKPVHTATIYRNVNSSTKSNTLKVMKVVELEQLVSRDTNKIFTSDTTSDIGSLTTENTFSLTPTLSKNNSIQRILSANINKDINATKEKSTTRDSTMSAGLYVQDKILTSVKSKHMQNTSIITNESPLYHENNNTDNFTKQIINSRVVWNTDANLYNANVKNIKLNISEKKQNQTLDSDGKSIVNFNNLSVNVENLTRHDQNISYKIVPNKTRKGDTNTLHFVTNADNKQSLSSPVQTNEDKRKVHIDKITPVKLNNLHIGYEIERTELKFDCNSRQRGKYSDKHDCQNFYICIGRDEPILGKCPNNTVFSEISKQCTRNLSHCIRNNQFQCTSAGRYVDIFSDQYYYICAKNVKGYIRFKLQCQKGYHLDKSKLKCILDTFNESLSALELSSLDLDMDMTNEESSKTYGEKSTIESRSKEEKDSKKQKKDFECKMEGKFLYPDDCRKYYQCTKTRKSKFRRKIKKCDSDEVFDSEKRKCVDEESYEC